MAKEEEYVDLEEVKEDIIDSLDEICVVLNESDIDDDDILKVKELFDEIKKILEEYL